MPFEKLAGIHWDIIGLSEVRRTGEGYTVLKGVHVLCHRGLADRGELGVGILVNKDLADAME